MKINWIRIAVFAVALLAVVAVLFGVGAVVFKKDQGRVTMETQTYALSDVTQIEITTDMPDVVIKPVSGDQINLSWLTDDYAKLDASLSGGKLQIDYKFRTNWLEALLMGPLAHSDYVLEIELPESYTGTIDIHTASGAISVYGALNLQDIRLTSVSGAVDGSDVASKETVAIRSTSGSIHADAVHAAEELLLQTVSGSVDLRKADAQGDVSIQTTSGGITVNELTAVGPVTVKTTSGKTELSKLSSDAAVSLHTVSGSAQVNGVECTEFSSVTVSGSTHFQALTTDTISMKSTSGSIKGTFAGNEDDYAISVRTVSGGSNLKSASGAGKEKSITLNTVSGSVSVQFDGASGQ